MSQDAEIRAQVHALEVVLEFLSKYLADLKGIPLTGESLEVRLDSLKWEGPSKGWWWIKKAAIPAAIEAEVSKWNKDGFKGGRFYYFVASKDGNLLKKERKV